MKQYMYILFTCLLGLTTAGPARAQAVTDKQYAAAQTAITYEATYRIYTFFNGTKDGTVRYYLNTEGFLTSVRTNAGQFQFHKTEGDELYRSPGWRTDCYFTNPTLSNGSWGELNNDGHIHTNRELARNDWEGQVWYKEGSLFAVRSTNANTSTETWGAGSYWNALDENGDHVPEAGYTWEPAFIWRLEKVGEPDPEEPVEQKHVRLTNLPHVYIDTFNGHSISSKSYYVYARMWYVNEEDSVLFYDSLMIRGRGNSTWSLDKKPYKIKFQNKEKFLGKGYAKAKKWTLLANHGDKTLIRNALTNLLGERTGLKFNPAAKFVDLTINGEFVGNYQISDQIDVRPHRVNITEQDYPLQEESDITGGYLLEADDFGDFHTSKYWDYEEGRYLNPDGFYSRTNNVPIRIHYPEPEELETAQKDYIQQIVNEFEKRVAAINFRDAVKGYRSYVDSLSLANWYICTEISANVDGFWSAYFYKEQGEDKLYWGPLWDYDIAYNNDNRARNGSTNTTKQLMSDAGYGTARAWVARMWKDPWFQKLIYRRYSELVRGGLEDYLNAQIDSLVLLLDQSVKLNYERWSINTSTLRERVLYSTYDQYVSDLRTFLSQRIPYLKTTFAKLAGVDPDADPDPKPKVPDFPAKPDVAYTIRNIGTGTAADIDLASNSVCARARTEERQSQLWQITPLANGYMFITNLATGYALNDPTEGEPTATTLTGTQLNTAEADSLSERQQWDIVSQENGRYNLINRFSQHAANLSGGGSEDGTPVLSYTSDDRDATSVNRLWYIEEAGSLDGIAAPEVQTDYALAYNPQSGRLHFGADNLQALTFVVRIYDQSGRLVSTFRASDGADMSPFPRGLYLITWKEAGRQRTVKMVH